MVAPSELNSIDDWETKYAKTMIDVTPKEEEPPEEEDVPF
jgi:hypothetical protein